MKSAGSSRWQRSSRGLGIGLVFLALVAVALLLRQGPINQDLDYHAFADQGTVFGIPNFWNVITNLPFVVVGLMGLRKLRNRTLPFGLAWRVFYGAVFLVGFGSAYYHWDPDNASLVWDRLPMAAGFMALFVAYVAEYVHERFDRALIPMVALGFVSVIVWAQLDDLRLYILVQFYPLLALILMLVFWQPFRREWPVLVPALLAYMIAKALETWDLELHHLLGGLIGGHPWKHVAAAAAPLFLLRRFRD